MSNRSENPLDYLEVESPIKKRNQKHTWTGIYKGIRYEIINWDWDFETTLGTNWCHYIILFIDQLPKEFADKFWLAPKLQKFSENGRDHVTYDYYNSPIGSLEFHGGCTYYSKERGLEGDERVVKIGCDYQHLFDDGNNYREWITTEYLKAQELLKGSTGL